MTIIFERPDQFGSTLHLDSTAYDLFVPGERLTDSFLDAVIKSKEESSLLFDFVDEDGNEINIFCNDSSIKVSYLGETKEYPATKQEFTDAFIENVRMYAIYWAAPINYRIIMERSFDAMVKKMETYRDGANAILAKLTHF